MKTRMRIKLDSEKVHLPITIINTGRQHLIAAVKDQADLVSTANFIYINDKSNQFK